VQGALLKLSAKGNPKGKGQLIDFSNVYSALGQIYSELNIEGAVVSGRTFKMFQRGNGPSGKNGVIDLSLEGVLGDIGAKRPISAKNIIGHRDYDLGKIAETRLGFTDAAASPSGEIFFIAAGERADSTYHDGAFAGAVLGKFNAAGDALVLGQIDIPLKPEGLSISDNGENFFVVTDADDSSKPAAMYQGKIP
jgi:hypothetical protein